MSDPKPSPAPRPADLPCAACGRDEAHQLTLGEALARHGYGRTSCPSCLLTEIPRPAVPSAQR
jgi:hypothetical protein